MALSRLTPQFQHSLNSVINSQQLPFRLHHSPERMSIIIKRFFLKNVLKATYPFARRKVASNFQPGFSKDNFGKGNLLHFRHFELELMPSFAIAYAV